MNVVDFSKQSFFSIPKQDNPAFNGEECIMIVQNQDVKHRLDILKVTQVPSMIDNENVRHVAIALDIKDALIIAKHYATL